LVHRAEAVDGQLIEPGLGCVVGGMELVDSPVRVDDHVVDEHHPLAPVVEGGQLADDGQDCVGLAQVVVRGVRQVLHLAHHVIPEITHQTGMQRGQVRQLR
jgi:hypothetical protein